MLYPIVERTDPHRTRPKHTKYSFQLLLLFLFLDVNVQLVQRPVEVLKSVILDALKLGATQ